MFLAEEYNHRFLPAGSGAIVLDTEDLKFEKGKVNIRVIKCKINMLFSFETGHGHSLEILNQKFNTSSSLNLVISSLINSCTSASTFPNLFFFNQINK